MGIRALNCPNCAGAIELDDQKEFGFCLHCGHKVQIGERVNVVHSGEVRVAGVISGEQQFKNYMASYTRYMDIDETQKALEMLDKAQEVLDREGATNNRIYLYRAYAEGAGGFENAQEHYAKFLKGTSEAERAIKPGEDRMLRKKPSWYMYFFALLGDGDRVSYCCETLGSPMDDPNTPVEPPFAVHYGGHYGKMYRFANCDMLYHGILYGLSWMAGYAFGYGFNKYGLSVRRKITVQADWLKELTGAKILPGWNPLHPHTIEMTYESFCRLLVKYKVIDSEFNGFMDACLAEEKKHNG